MVSCVRLIYCKILVLSVSVVENFALESSRQIQGGARNVIPLIVHVTHFYYYKNI